MIEEWLVRFGRTAGALVAWVLAFFVALSGLVGVAWAVHAALVWAWPGIDGVRGSFWYGFGWLPSIFSAGILLAAAIDATVETRRKR